MFKEYTGAMASAIGSVFKRDRESGLVRMFRVEYYKEYMNAKRFGAKIDDAFIKTYIREHKQ